MGKTEEFDGLSLIKWSTGDGKILALKELAATSIVTIHIGSMGGRNSRSRRFVCFEALRSPLL